MQRWNNCNRQHTHLTISTKTKTILLKLSDLFQVMDLTENQTKFLLKSKTQNNSNRLVLYYGDFSFWMQQILGTCIKRNRLPTYLQQFSLTCQQIAYISAYNPDRFSKFRPKIKKITQIL